MSSYLTKAGRLNKILSRVDENKNKVKTDMDKNTKPSQKQKWKTPHQI
jgi:hypothetical protein